MAVIVVGLVLMPVSQAASWLLLLQATDIYYNAILPIALFYTGWALCNRFVAGNTYELGFIPLGILSLAALLRKRNYSLVGVVLVFVSYGVAAVIAFTHSASKLGMMLHHDDTTLGLIWGWTYQAYILSNLCLYGKMARSLKMLPPDGYDLLH